MLSPAREWELRSGPQPGAWLQSLCALVCAEPPATHIEMTCRTLMIIRESYHLSRHRPGPPAFPGCQQLACHVPATTQTVDGWSRHGQVAATSPETYYFPSASIPTNPHKSHFQAQSLSNSFI